MVKYRKRKTLKLIPIISIIISIILAVFLIISLLNEKQKQEEYAEWANDQNQAFYDELKQAEEEAEAEAEAEVEALKVIENNSSFYQKLNYGFDVNILVVGDSIGAGTDDTSWAGLLKSYIDEEYESTVTLTNVSMGGNASYAGYVRTMMLDDDVEYDLAVICYGQNDSSADFSLYYESIIRAINSKYEKCSIISILESSQREYTQKMLDIQELTEYYNNIEIADTIMAFDESGYDYDELSDDGTHPNDLGKTIYFETIKSIVDENVILETDYMYDEVTPFNETVTDFDTFKYISVDEFEKVDELTYTIQTESISGIMGIYYSYVSGENEVNIYIDDTLLTTKAVTFDYDFSQMKIHIVENDVNVEESITLVFASEDQADNFKGLIFSNID